MFELIWHDLVYLSLFEHLRMSVSPLELMRVTSSLSTIVHTYSGLFDLIWTPLSVPTDISNYTSVRFLWIYSKFIELSWVYLDLWYVFKLMWIDSWLLTSIEFVWPLYNFMHMLCMFSCALVHLNLLKLIYMYLHVYKVTLSQLN